MVDYKTDHVSPAALTEYAARYVLQGGAYALAVERATGQAVSTLHFVFAAVGEGTVVDYPASQVAELMQRAAAAARTDELVAGLAV